jgi:hypothetical protein
MFIKGLIAGVILGFLLGLYHRKILAGVAYIIAFSVVLLPVAAIAYAFYAYTDDAIFISILIVCIVAVFIVSKLIESFTFFNTDEASAITVGIAAQILLISSAANNFSGSNTLGRTALFVLVVLAFQGYVYYRSRIRRVTEAHNNSSNLTGAHNAPPS